MHEHDTDDVAPILGAGIVIQESHQQEIQQIKSHDHELTMKHNMCNWSSTLLISGMTPTLITLKSVSEH